MKVLIVESCAAGSRAEMLRAQELEGARLGMQVVGDLEPNLDPVHVVSRIMIEKIDGVFFSGMTKIEEDRAFALLECLIGQGMLIVVGSANVGWIERVRKAGCTDTQVTFKKEEGLAIFKKMFESRRGAPIG